MNPVGQRKGVSAMSETPQQSAGLEKCPFCGSELFTWGKMSGQVRFTVNSLQNLFPGLGQKIEARKCDGCSNIQLFLHPPMEIHY